MRDRNGFLNVDLEVGAKKKPGALVDDLGARLHNLWTGRFKGLYRANYELHPKRILNPSETIVELVKVVKKLGRAARREWNHAPLRDFNVGVQAALEQYTFELAVDPRAVELVAGVGGQIGITVYAPFPKPERRRR